MELKTRANVNLYYEEMGQGNEIVFIHGWSGSSEFFKPQLEELSKSNRVIIYDLKGHGRSEVVDRGLTMKGFAEDLQDLIIGLKLNKPVLIGWSMGAMIIFEYIKQFGTESISKIGILDMTPKLINDKTWSYGLSHGIFIEEDQKYTLTLLADDYGEYLKKFIKFALPYKAEEDLIQVFKDAEKNSPLVLIAMWHAMGVSDYRQILHDIDIPALIVYGGKSTLYNADTARYMADRISKSKLVEFESATHFLVVEEADRLTKEVYDFVNKD